MGGSSPDGETKVRYAKYLEEEHQNLLHNAWVLYEAYKNEYNPWEDMDWLPSNVEYGVFGEGYEMKDYPSLYDMYGKFMAGLDIEPLWTQAANDIINNAAINTRVSSFGVDLNTKMVSEQYPRLRAGYRDINAIMSSTFIVAEELLEEEVERSITRYDSELRVRAMAMINPRWSAHLEWNKRMIAQYIDMMKLYYSAKMDAEGHSGEMIAKRELWKFTLLGEYRASVSCMTGATNTASGSGASTTQKVLGGALSGAAAGAMMGFGAPGAVVGGLAGGLMGLA